jgi:hypothetical protein
LVRWDKKGVVDQGPACPGESVADDMKPAPVNRPRWLSAAQLLGLHFRHNGRRILNIV